MIRLARAIPVLTAAFLAAGGPLRAQQVSPGKVAASVRRLFGDGAHIDSIAVDSSVVLRISRVDSLLGFAQVRDVIGKDQPITFLVAIDPEDRLKDVDILVYREPYGGEVAYDSWRKQFRGKTAADSVAIGRNIRSISGATISSNSVTAGVRRAVEDLTEWHQGGRLK